MFADNITTDISDFIEHFNEQSFNWVTWRGGSISEIFGIRHRFEPIYRNRDLIKEYAIGWCKSDNIPCRPKVGYISVMFETDFRRWWTHFTVKEFLACFPDIEL